MKEIPHRCGVGYDVRWSPNGDWFDFGLRYDIDKLYFNATCIAHLTDASIYEVETEEEISANFAWDKTGNYIYFIMRNRNPKNLKDFKVDERLMRYDVRTQKAERLFSIRERLADGYPSQLKISPNKNKILIYWSDELQGEHQYMVLNVESMTTTRFANTIPNFLTWSADSQHLIYFISQRDDGSVAPRVFVQFDIQTQKTTVFTGWHLIDVLAISPVPIFP